MQPRNGGAERAARHVDAQLYELGDQDAGHGARFPPSHKGHETAFGKTGIGFAEMIRIAQMAWTRRFPPP
jgi:hypothetical protein